MSKRMLLRVGLVTAAVALAPVLAACSADSEADSGSEGLKLNIGLCSDPTCLVPLTAVEKGFFEKHGIDASYQLFTNSSDSMNAALAGDVDIAGTQTDIQMLGARAKGASLQSFVLVGHTSEQVALIGTSDIKGPEDLVGKNVGVPFGTAPQLFQALYFDRHGIDPDDVAISNLAPPDQVAAFSRGDVDAFFGVQPNLSTALGVVAGSHIINYSGDDDVYVPYLTMTAHSEWLQEHQEDAANVIRALREAAEWLNENKAEALELAQRVYRLEPEVAEVILPVQIFKVSAATDAESLWSTDAEFLSRVKIPGFPEISDPEAVMEGIFDTSAYELSLK